MHTSERDCRSGQDGRLEETRLCEDAVKGSGEEALGTERGSRSSYSSSMCNALMGQRSGWLEQLVLRVIKLSVEPDEPARQRRGQCRAVKRPSDTTRLITTTGLYQAQRSNRRKRRRGKKAYIPELLFHTDRAGVRT